MKVHYQTDRFGTRTITTSAKESIMTMLGCKSGFVVTTNILIVTEIICS